MLKRLLLVEDNCCLQCCKPCCPTSAPNPAMIKVELQHCHPYSAARYSVSAIGCMIFKRSTCKLPRSLRRMLTGFFLGNRTCLMIFSGIDILLLFLQGWTCTQVFEGHSHYVMQVVFNPKDTNTFASASLDRTVKVGYSSCWTNWHIA